jgi:hypothetical protein
MIDNDKSIEMMEDFRDQRQNLKWFNMHVLIV